MSAAGSREVNFDGLVGPTHNYAGLSRGNVASTRHAGDIANPRAAALQGLAKMRFVRGLGVLQAVLPPHPRPDVDALRRLGFSGDDATVLARASEGDGHLLRLCSSASAMWTANAATVAPSSDTMDGRVHFVPANLSSMFHRSLEAPLTTRVLRTIFANEEHFVVRDPLPGSEHFADEGAANHTRLYSASAVVHLFGWGREAWGADAEAHRFPRRQTREASTALVRCHALDAGKALVWRQDPRGIDAGAFHSDVLCVGNESFLMLHEWAFENAPALLEELRRRLGDAFSYCLAREDELAASDAVACYPFNSQLLALPNGRMGIVAPVESERHPATRRYLERVVCEDNPVDAVHYVDVNASMNNGGGPACLRLRVVLSEDERRAVNGRIFVDEVLDADLVKWVERHYRDRLSRDDLRDPKLLDETRTALDELATLLALGSIYDFQR